MKPCAGCYFAVLKKNKGKYTVEYTTPVAPDMGVVVRNKQEVLYVMANGDYAPFWSWRDRNDDDLYANDNSSKFGECLFGLLSNDSYECKSAFWVNAAVKDAVGTLGIGVAINGIAMAFGSFSASMKINKKEVMLAYESLVVSPVFPCAPTSRRIFRADDVFTLQPSTRKLEPGLYMYKTMEGVKCFDSKDYVLSVEATNNQAILFPKEGGSAFEVMSLVDGGLKEAWVENSSACLSGAHVAIDQRHVKAWPNGRDMLVFRENGRIQCLSPGDYSVQYSNVEGGFWARLRPLKMRGSTILMKKEGEGFSAVYYDETSLSFEKLFDIEQKMQVDNNSLVINLPYTKRMTDFKVADLDRFVGQEVQKFISIPQVAQPSIPPSPTLVKGEFEKEAAFRERVLLEVNKREEQVRALQEKYRNDVVRRNEIAAERLKQVEGFARFISRKRFEQILGAFILENPRYDAEAEIMYADLKSTNSDFTRQVAISVPIASGEMRPAEVLKNAIEQQWLYRVKVSFSLNSDQIVLDDVQVTLNGNAYLTRISNEGFSPRVVEVKVPETQTELNDVYQNPNLADSINIPKLSLVQRTVQGSLSYVDDVAVPVSQLLAIEVDPQKWLFLIGIENYKETDKVIFANNSAKQVAEVMRKRLGISERNSYVLIDADATAGAISDKLERMLANVKPGDTIYFYYSGHGVPDPASSEAYILPGDKVVDFIVREKNFQLVDIYRRLSLSGAAKVVAFIDACFSGRTDNSSLFKGTAPGLIRVKDVEIDAATMTVISAGKNTQFSNSYDNKGHRMFSYFLIRSLLKERGSPVDLNTIYQEVSVGVRDASSAKGDIYLQEPQIYGNPQQSL
jgi:hypothetical protein